MLAALDVQPFYARLLAFALNYIPGILVQSLRQSPIAQVLVFNGFYEALLVLAGYADYYSSTYSGAAYHGAWAGAFHIGDIFVVDFGMVVRTGGYAAFRAR